jgi:hypothetical protein
MGAHQYTIRLLGHLDEHWFRRFTGLTLTHTADGETVITAAALDQAALHAILSRVRDLGLELIAVQRAPPQAPADAGGTLSAHTVRHQNRSA